MGSADDRSRLGAGFLVWESNRSGDWRIWIQDLDKEGSRQLSPDEPGRQHCCAHISPDGSQLTYLSLAFGRKAFANSDVYGEMHLIDPSGSSDRVIAEDAHSYFENRAAVWRSATELIYIGSQRQTRLLDLDSGEIKVLIAEPGDGYGRIVNSTLTHATSGRPSFDLYDMEAKRFAARRDLGGCQPYFSHDGRSGFWTAGGGGPFKHIDLGTRTTSTLLKKGDSRLAPDRGYIYFPMYSRDGRLLAFSASTGEHSHFTADYDVFVVETDPETLELLERPIRMTADPGTDRFPDVFQEPLPLGRQAGEVPLTVRFEPPNDGAWEWSFGDGAEGKGPIGEHSYSRPGSYAVVARAEETVLRGRVIVREARPPQPIQTEVRNDLEVIVRFDEPIRADGAQARFESGRRMFGLTVGGDGRSVEIELEEPYSGFDQLHLSGVEDRAEQPNRMAPAKLDVEPPLWPSSRDGLVFLWGSGDAANLIDDVDLGAARACSVQARGLARLDHDFAMELGRGSFNTGIESGEYVVRRAKSRNEISIELTLTPYEESEGRTSVLMTSSDGRGYNFVLAQRDGRLFLQLRTGPRAGAYPWTELVPIEIGRPQHLVLTFATHQLTAYLDGSKKIESDAVRGDLYQWRPRDLFFGSDPGGGQPWKGKLEGVAVYERVLEADEVLENSHRYRQKLLRRPAVETVVVDARLVRHSQLPTLEEINPYREALVTLEFEVEEVIEGSFTGSRIRVARWAILDSEVLLQANPPLGERSQLTLELFADNPQLESVYLSDTLGNGESGPLYYAAAP